MSLKLGYSCNFQDVRQKFRDIYIPASEGILFLANFSFSPPTFYQLISVVFMQYVSLTLIFKAAYFQLHLVDFPHLGKLLWSVHDSLL